MRTALALVVALALLSGCRCCCPKQEPPRVIINNGDGLTPPSFSTHPVPGCWMNGDYIDCFKAQVVPN